MELATGRRGSPHITSQQDRQKHQGIFGDGAYILNTGNMLEPEVQSSNKIHIKDGALMFQGALFTVKVGTYDEVTINNGNQGMKRKDLIVARYTYDSSDNIEAGEWAVIQGTPAADNPVVPEATSGDIQAGDSVVECPVFVVNLDGINVTGVDIIPETMRDMSTLNADLSEFLNRCSYSDSGEIETNETWVDGKKIYRRTFITTETVSPSNTVTIPMSLTNIADTLWIDTQNSYIRSADGGQSYPLPLPRYSGTANYVGVWCNGAGIRIFSDSGWNQQWEKCVTVRYTKK